MNSSKKILIKKLKDEHCFWSIQEPASDIVPDDILIEKVMIYLDLEEIDMLFDIYGFKKVKQVWLENLIPQGDYLFQLNRFFAWYYFKAKSPGSYVKSMATRHQNRLLQK